MIVKLSEPISCSLEPITTPGAIQPHGALLCFNTQQDMRLIAISENCAQMLGEKWPCVFKTSDKEIWQSSVRDIFDSSVTEKILDWFAKTREPGIILELTMQVNNNDLSLYVHTTGDQLIVEVKPFRNDDLNDTLEAARILPNLINSIKNAAGVMDLCQRAVDCMRSISRYERVIVYKFDDEWNGQALAESKVNEWEESLLGLHFPSSDIPSQARALYHRSTFRWMPYRDYQPVALIGAPGYHKPVDLSFSRLRSMSPVHRQYHANMGVDGSMSISLMDGKNLWGLVVCHHRTSHWISSGRRNILCSLVDAIGMRIATSQQFDAIVEKQNDMKIMDKIINDLTHNRSLMDGLLQNTNNIGQLFECSGAVVVLDQEWRSVGWSPTQDKLHAIVSWVKLKLEKETWYTDKISKHLPILAEDISKCCGLLACRISSDSRDFIIWFKPEDKYMFEWGGNPYKELGEDQKVHPRLSFLRYLDEHTGRSKPWKTWEIELAHRLHLEIVEKIAFHFKITRDLNEQLRQSQKMEALGRLVGGVAHDFNNLLNVIIGSLDMIQRKLKREGGDAKIGSLSTTALQAADRAASLTNSLLVFSRRQALKKEQVDVNKLVSKMSDILERTLGEGIELRTSLRDKLWTACIDSNQMENAIINLAVNARDAMPKGGILTIETDNISLDVNYTSIQSDELEPGDFVCLSVSDTGTGMDSDTLSKVFEPFFTTKEVGKGTGLGVSQVYGFIKQSGGHIKFYSQPGQGTTVKLYIPRCMDNSEVLDGDIEQEQLPMGTESVLLVEDDENVRASALLMLGNLGYQVFEARNAQQAFDILRSEEIDVLLTDLGLPGGVNGKQLAELSRKLSHDITVILTTGYAPHAMNATGQMEEHTVLYKPYRMFELAKILAEVLEHKRGKIQ